MTAIIIKIPIKKPIPTKTEDNIPEKKFIIGVNKPKNIENADQIPENIHFTGVKMNDNNHNPNHNITKITEHPNKRNILYPFFYCRLLICTSSFHSFKQ